MKKAWLTAITMGIALSGATFLSSQNVQASSKLVPYKNAKPTITSKGVKTIYTFQETNAGYSVDLARSPEKYDGDYFVHSIKDPGIPLKLKGFTKTQNNHLAIVEYRGETLYTLGPSTYLKPYNTIADHARGMVDSNVNPNNKSKVMLKAYQHVGIHETWSYTNSYTGALKQYRYSVKHHKWYQLAMND